MRQMIESMAEESARVIRESITQNVGLLYAAATMIAEALAAGGKILLCGNGGSAADSQHIAAEFVNRFAMERPALAAVALTTDTSTLTAIANDYSFDDIFARQVMALGRPGDLCWAISTSGRSPNVLLAADAARRLSMRVLAFTGGAGLPLSEKADICFIAASSSTPRIQEAHITAAHILCDLSEKILFPRSREV
ncbi:MAG: D-sedoheptulose 7-phosphate isomerase [Thermodesulfobacteriota bacterium]